MGLSIGGGLGPFGVRVGTRGIGMRVGPLRASSGYGRRRRRGSNNSPGGCGIVIIALMTLLAIYYVVAWPYLLGTWLAVQAGALNPSTTRTVVGWVFEGAYPLVLLATAVAVSRRAQAVRDEELRQEQAAERRAQLEQDRQRAADQAALTAYMAAEDAAIAAIAAQYRHRGRSPLRTSALTVGLRGRPGEQLGALLNDVDLLEPRVPYRGASPIPTRVETGTLLVTTQRLLFQGDVRTCEWNFARFLRVNANHDQVLISVSNRQTVKGVGFNSAAARFELQCELAIHTGPATGPGSLTELLDDVEQDRRPIGS